MQIISDSDDFLHSPDGILIIEMHLLPLFIAVGKDYIFFPSFFSLLNTEKKYITNFIFYWLSENLSNGYRYEESYRFF